ncbi:MAG TPA: hypothetical protein VIM16_08760 [Mucilaginibacter sp.]|jgi:hypothetical protein
MDLLKALSRILLITLIFFLTGQSLSYADGGFPVRPGRLLISPSISYFFANSGWDANGVKAPFVNNGQFSSVGVTFYSEYGISRRWAFVATLPYVFNNYTQSVSPKSTISQGLTDLETGIRYYLANINFIYYFSLQGTAITPLYTNNPSLGYGEEGAELKLAVSGSGHLFGESSYFNLSDGVRQYFGTDGPWQNRYSGTYGLSLDKKFMNMISATVSGVNSFSNNKAFSPIPETNKDFSFLQASLGYGHSFTRETALFISGGKFLTGHNTGAGTSVTLAFIYRLDYR